MLTPYFIFGALTLISGILFCAFRADLISVLMTIVGAFAILFGAYELLRRRFTEGATAIALGIVVIACGWTVVNITLLIFGIALIAYSVYRVVCRLPKLKRADAKGIIKIMALPVAYAVFGTLFIIAARYTVDAVFIVIGALGIAAGIVAMLTKPVAERAE